MAIEAERLLAIFEAKFDSLDKALAKSRGNAQAAFAGIEAAGTQAEASLSTIGTRGVQGFDKLAKSAQGAKVQTGNLAAQLNDIGVQLAGGQSPFLIALQQGTQINQALGDAGAKGAITALGGAFASLVNPVGLATIAVITLGGVAFQYFSSLLSNGQQSEETLRREAELIQKVADKWGDALPALKAYNDERQRLANAGEIKDASAAAQAKILSDIVTQLSLAGANLDDYNNKLEVLGGNEKTVNGLRDAFGTLNEKAQDLKATSQDYQVVIDLMNKAMQDTSVQGGQAFLEILTKLQEQADQTRESISKMSAQAAGAALLQLAGNRPQTTGGPARYQTGQLDLPGSAPVPDSAPNREDVLAEQDRRNAAAARRASRSQRLTADDKIGEDIQAIRDRTAALQQEASMIGLSYEEQQKRKMALGLEQEALKRLREEAARKGVTDLASIHLSADQVAAIDTASEAYARQADILRQVRQNQQDAEQAASDFYETFKSGAIGAITGAENVQDAIKGILSKLADLALNSLFDSLFQPRSGSASGGLFGGLFSSIGSFITGSFASGTNSAPGGLAWVGERGRELVNLPKGSQVVPNDISEGLVNGGGASSGSQSVHVTVGVSADSNGNLLPFVQSVSTRIAAGVVGQARPQLAKDAEASVRHSQRNNPGRWR